MYGWVALAYVVVAGMFAGYGSALHAGKTRSRHPATVVVVLAVMSMLWPVILVLPGGMWLGTRSTDG